MPALPDVRFDALRAQGFTGATSDMVLQWLKANGATSNSLPDAWREMLTLLAGNVLLFTTQGTLTVGAELSAPYGQEPFGYGLTAGALAPTAFHGAELRVLACDAFSNSAVMRFADDQQGAASYLLSDSTDGHATVARLLWDGSQYVATDQHQRTTRWELAVGLDITVRIAPVPRALAGGYQRNDWWHYVLKAYGYQGSQLNELEMAFWTAGGTFGPDIPPILDTPYSARLWPRGVAVSENWAANWSQPAGLTFTTTGLPAGLSLSAAGQLTGTPTTASTTQARVTATNEVGPTQSNQFNTEVYPPPVLATPYGDRLWPVGVPVSINMATNWTSRVAATYAAIGLPAGLTLSSAGMLTGTPTAVTASGPVVISATNPAGTTNAAAFTAETYGAPVQTANYPNLTYTTNDQVNVNLATSWTSRVAATFATSNLPTGLSLSSAGVLSGSPGVADQVRQIIVVATNPAGSVNSNQFTITTEAGVVRLFRDTFTAANNTQIASRPSDEGGTWTAASSFIVNFNRMINNSTSTSRIFARTPHEILIGRALAQLVGNINGSNVNQWSAPSLHFWYNGTSAVWVVEVTPTNGTNRLLRILRNGSQIATVALNRVDPSVIVRFNPNGVDDGPNMVEVTSNGHAGVLAVAVNAAWAPAGQECGMSVVSASGAISNGWGCAIDNVEFWREG